jgi:DNA-binding LacI/PurR family transcriptional regulator
MPTPEPPEPTGAPPATRKQDAVIHALRRGIADGTWAPGARLPTREELQQRFGVASATLQRALDRLSADGFIVARGRQGTFVVDHPAAAVRYGLVLPALVAPAQVRFWTALAHEADAFARAASPRRITLYQEIDGRVDAPDHLRLVSDLRHDRLAGLVFAVNPFAVMRTPVITRPGVPRIAIMDAPNPPVAAAALDEAGFIAKALDHFRARRRTRVAVLSVPGLEGGFRKRLEGALSERWLETRPYWWHTLDHASAVGARALVHLLMHPGQDVRPDALFITDDNLVEPATAGLLAAGVRVPEDVAVVAHCNFPWPTAAATPARRLGYDAREVLLRCLDWIDAQRAGRAVEQRILVPARFADERVEPGA